MTILDFEKFKQSPVVSAPYAYCKVTNFINCDFEKQLNDEFPRISSHGSFPRQSLNLTTIYQQLVSEFFSKELKEITSDKFGVDLKKAKEMITFRGQTKLSDGKIHLDSNGKIITFLLYLNPNWQTTDGGNLRILKNEHDIHDFVDEIQPHFGTLIVFECTSTAFHGHLPFEGQRRSLQFNYVKNGSYHLYEQYRHRFSAFWKGLTKPKK